MNHSKLKLSIVCYSLTYFPPLLTGRVIFQSTWYWWPHTARQEKGGESWEAVRHVTVRASPATEKRVERVLCPWWEIWATSCCITWKCKSQGAIVKRNLGKTETGGCSQGKNRVIRNDFQWQIDEYQENVKFRKPPSQVWRAKNALGSRTSEACQLGEEHAVVDSFIVFCAVTF